MAQLSKRLKTIADMVTPGSVLCDVGCDHAFLSIDLLERGRVSFAVCSDINEGPLARAQEHIRAQHLEDKTSLVLWGGIPEHIEELVPVVPDEGIAVVIAGMGGELMGKILSDAKDRLIDFHEFVLSPQSELMEFRCTLQDLGLSIEEERFFLDEGKYYTVMRAVPGSGDKVRMSRVELAYGPCLIREKNPDLLRFLQKRSLILKGIMENIEKNAGASGLRRMPELEKEKAFVDNTIKIMEER